MVTESDEKVHQQPPKCLARNIVLTLLSIAPLWLIVSSLSGVFVSFDKSAMQVAVEIISVLCFTIIGIVVAFKCSKAVQAHWQHGDVTNAVEIAHKTNRWYLITFALILTFFIYIAIAVPGFASYENLRTACNSEGVRIFV